MSDGAPQPADGPAPAHDGSTDPRPMPQYGEYATPEEQRARIRQPEATAHLEAGHVAPPPPSRPAPVPQPWGPPAPPWAPPAGRAPASVARGPRPGDRIATTLLLGFGLVYVLLSAGALLDLPAAMTQAMHTIGIPGTFTNVESARLWGVVAAVVLVVGFLGTAVLAIRSLRRGRLAWWIPVVGAVATFAVVYGLIAIPLLGDPAFMDYVTRSSRG